MAWLACALDNVYPFFRVRSRESRQAQMDANRAAQQLRRDSETPEITQTRLQWDAAYHQSSRASGK